MIFGNYQNMNFLENLNISFFAAAVSSNTEQHISREQQHHHLPGSHRHLDKDHQIDRKKRIQNKISKKKRGQKHNHLPSADLHLGQDRQTKNLKKKEKEIREQQCHCQICSQLFNTCRNIHDKVTCAQDLFTFFHCFFSSIPLWGTMSLGYPRNSRTETLVSFRLIPTIPILYHFVHRQSQFYHWYVDNIFLKHWLERISV